MWNTKGLKLLCFCVTFILQKLWAGTLYLPIKWQRSPNFSDSKICLQNREMFFLKSSSFYSVIMISFLVFYEKGSYFFSNSITSFTYQSILPYPKGDSLQPSSKTTFNSDFMW